MSMVKRQKVIDEEEVKEMKWEDMNCDILCKIFSTFTLLEVVLHISKVCKSWRDVCRNESIWDTLDFTKLKDHFNIPATLYAWSDYPYSRRFWNILKAAIDLGNVDLTRIIFDLHICITTKHLICIATRCPNVKLLVLPARTRIRPQGYIRAFGTWKGLEAVVLSGSSFSVYIIKLLGEHCKKLTSLKTIGFVTGDFALSLTCYLPWLKALSIKSSIIRRDTLVLILECLKELQELNVSHCVLIDGLISRVKNIAYDQSLLAKAAHLQIFHYCKVDKDCTTCLAVKRVPIGMASLRSRELLMRFDEIKKLSY